MSSTGFEGNITHVFSGTDAPLLHKINYEDFAQAQLDTAISPNHDPTNDAPGYEEKQLDPDTNLLDFGARWYDTLFARFTTADTILFDSRLRFQIRRRLQLSRLREQFHQPCRSDAVPESLDHDSA